MLGCFDQFCPDLNLKFNKVQSFVTFIDHSSIDSDSEFLLLIQLLQLLLFDYSAIEISGNA